MHIGIDARLAGAHGRGIGRYIAELLVHLEKIDRTNEYTIVVSRADPPPARGGVRGGGSVIAFTMKNPDRFHVVEARSRWYSASEQFEIPRIFSRARCDLVHIPHFNVPFFLHSPFVVTIHDFILRDFPTPEGSRLPAPVFYAKHCAYRIAMRRAVIRARHVFVPTAYVRDRLLHAFPEVPRDRVTVTREGVSFSEPEESASLPRSPYVLVVGSAYPHKNLEALVDAFFRVRKTHPDLSLVFVGKEDHFMMRLKQYCHSERGARRISRSAARYLDSLPAGRQGLGLAQDDRRGDEGFHFLGAVSDTHLAALYRNAAALAFVSLEEGFGLPGVEALAHGTSVLSSHQSALPEVYGKYAVYVNPNDCAAIAWGLVTVLSQTVEEKPLGEAFPLRRGLSSSGAGAWKRMAEQTVAAYQRAISRRRKTLDA